jgi:hypothetical protein
MTKVHTSFLSLMDTIHLPLCADLGLELSDCAEHVEKQATGCTSGVDVLIQHLEVGLLAFEISGNLAQMKR